MVGTISSGWALRSRDTSHRPDIRIPAHILSPYSLCHPEVRPPPTRHSVQVVQVLTSAAPEPGVRRCPLLSLSSEALNGMGIVLSWSHAQKATQPQPLAGSQLQDRGQLQGRATSVQQPCSALGGADNCATLTCAPAGDFPASAGCVAPHWQQCPSPALTPASPRTQPWEQDSVHSAGIGSTLFMQTIPINDAVRPPQASM